MLIEEALRLRQNWAVQGNPSCSHPKVDRENFRGKDVDNYVCTVCGQSFTHGEWEREIEKRENEVKSIVDSWTTGRTGRLVTSIRSLPKRCAKLYPSLSRVKTNNHKRHSK
jgi:hypothetical protein